MKKILIMMLGIMVVSAYAEQALDEQSNQEVILSPQNAEISTIVEKMNQAKASGNHALFTNLLSEYKRLNPPAKTENGPQGQVMAPEPVIGTSGTSIRWADDVTVDSAWNYQAFSMDTRDDGFIFLAAARESLSATEYRIPIWYSSDGVNWAFYYNIFWIDHDCRNPSVKIVEQATATYLVVVFDGIETASPYEEDVWVLVHEFTTTDWIYYPVSNFSGIDEKNPSLDADDIQYPTIAYLYCAFESADSIAAIGSMDFGQTWVDRQIIGSGDPTWDYYDPVVAYGHYSPADSFTIGVAWVIGWDSNNSIRFRRSHSYGTPGTWLDIDYFIPPTDHRDWRPALKMTHGTMPSGTIIFARRDTVGTDVEDLCNYFTYDGGRHWTCDTLYYGGEYALLTTLAVDDPANDYHAFFKGDYDDIRYKEAHYDGFDYNGWTMSMPISDGGNISSGTYPASATLNDEPCVCWKDITNSTWYKIKFDALWLTGIEERPGQISAGFVSLAPNPSNGIAKLSYVVKNEGNVKISVFDAVGRLVDNLLNETKPAGEYTVNMNNQNLAAG
ncbi:hypothetical protein KA005_15155, partial [bacterium]|nr:hypothetical protein [bacterium]